MWLQYALVTSSLDCQVQLIFVTNVNRPTGGVFGFLERTISITHALTLH